MQHADRVFKGCMLVWIVDMGTAQKQFLILAKGVIERGMRHPPEPSQTAPPRRLPSGREASSGRCAHWCVNQHFMAFFLILAGMKPYGKSVSNRRSFSFFITARLFTGEKVDIFFFNAPFLRRRLVVSRPHGQAASCRCYARLQDSVQRQRREVRACRDAGRLAKGSGDDGRLHSDRQHAPPPSRPARCRCLPNCGGRAARAQTDQVSDEPQRAAIPAASHFGPEHDQPLRAAPCEFWVAARLRLSAARSAAPSVSAAQGCGRPVRVSGDTRVASQHKARPSGVAP